MGATIIAMRGMCRSWSERNTDVTLGSTTCDQGSSIPTQFLATSTAVIFPLPLRTVLAPRSSLPAYLRALSPVELSPLWLRLGSLKRRWAS